MPLKTESESRELANRIDALDCLNNLRGVLERAQFLLSLRDDYAVERDAVPREYGYLIDTAEELLAPALAEASKAKVCMEASLQAGSERSSRPGHRKRSRHA